jgi:hypothetical protein
MYHGIESREGSQVHWTPIHGIQSRDTFSQFYPVCSIIKINPSAIEYLRGLFYFILTIHQPIFQNHLKLVELNKYLCLYKFLYLLWKYKFRPCLGQA